MKRSAAWLLAGQVGSNKLRRGRQGVSRGGVGEKWAAAAGKSENMLVVRETAAASSSEQQWHQRRAVSDKPAVAASRRALIAWRSTHAKREKQCAAAIASASAAVEV